MEPAEGRLLRLQVERTSWQVPQSSSSGHSWGTGVFLRLKQPSPPNSTRKVRRRLRSASNKPFADISILLLHMEWQNCRDCRYSRYASAGKLIESRPKSQRSLEMLTCVLQWEVPQKRENDSKNVPLKVLKDFMMPLLPHPLLFSRYVSWISHSAELIHRWSDSQEVYDKVRDRYTDLLQCLPFPFSPSPTPLETTRNYLRALLQSSARLNMPV